MNDSNTEKLLNRFAEMLEATTLRLESRIDSVRDEVTEFRAATEFNYDGLTKRFDGLESRLITFETKVYQRFDAVDTRFDGLERRLTLVERTT